MSSARFVVAVLAILVALTIIPANVDAGSGTQVLNGDQRYEVGGGSGPSIAYPNGIILSDLTNPGYAVWRFQIHGVPPAYNATVSVNYTESLGNGPTISLFNWTLSAWDPIAIDVGTGLYSNYSVYVPSMSYVNASGSIYVNVSAEAAEFIDIGTVTVNWAYDDTPPSNPNNNVSTPSVDVWTTDNTVDVEWSGASDDVFDVAGYSLLWSQSSPDLPDMTIDTVTNSNSSTRPDGMWYLHIRTVDGAGNWNSTSYDVGPFRIDTTRPTNPILNTSSPSTGIWSNDSTVLVVWSGAADAGSGVQGYSFEWSQDSSTVPDTIMDTTETSNSSLPLTDGIWYLHVRSVDNVTLWADDAYHIGPFRIDTVQPVIEITSPTDGAIQNTTTVGVSWAGSGGLSDIDHYEIQINSSIPVNVGASNAYQFLSVPDGTHVIIVRAFDTAGNQNIDSVNVTVDTVAPSVDWSIDGVLGSNGWYVTAVNVTISGSDATSGVRLVSYNLDSGGWQDYAAPIQITGDGVHTLLFYAEDFAMNRNPTSSIEVKIDTTQLYLTFNIQNGTIFRVSSVVISWTVYNDLSGIDHFEYSLDGGDFQSLGTTNSVGLVSLSEGPHSLVVKAFAVAGDVAEMSITFTVDTLPPSLTFDVLNGTMFTSKPVIINWTSGDNNTGIDRFEYSLDGGPFVSNGNVTSLSLADVSDGSRILRVRAYDNAGNIAERSLSFMVDTQPPELAFTTQGVAYFNTRSVAITWTASDAASGIDRYEYGLDSGVFIQFGTPASVRLDLVDVAEGTHFLALRAYDGVGNLVERSLTFVVDIQPPTLTFNIQNGTAFASRPVAINWSSADSNSGIARFEYALDIAAWVAVGTSTTVNLADVSEGAHILTVRAYDRAGNIARMSLEFVVDTQPPSLAFDVPDGAFFNSTSATIAWTSSDEVSGVANFTYRLDVSDFRSIGDNRSVNLVGLSDTTHVLTVRAYDRVGNYFETSLAFLVDTRSPILTLDTQDGASFSSSTVTITWLSQDSGSGISRFEYSLDDGPFKSVGSAMSVALTGLSDGTHVVTIRAIDQAGNVEEKAVTIQVNASGPLLFIAVMILNAIVISAVVIGWRLRKGKRR